MRWRHGFVGAIAALSLATILGCYARKEGAERTSATGAGDFAPLDQWKNAVIAGDATELKSLYSSDPAAEVSADGAKSDAESDAKFWLGLKAKTLGLQIVRTKSKGDLQNIIFRAEIEGAATDQTISVTDSITWQKQGNEWRIRGVERTDAPQLQQPGDMKKDIYPANADAHTEIREAEQRAAAEHKRLLLVFGANWCYDCHVLDLAFHGPVLGPVVQANYEVVHVDLGDDEKKNADLVKRYEIPLNKGIPALAVAESDGRPVVSQKNGEFENARGLTQGVLLAFLNRWKPGND